MTVTVVVTPGATITATTDLTPAKLNQLAQPTVSVAVSALGVSDWSLADYNAKLKNAPVLAAAKNLVIQKHAGSSVKMDITADEVILKSIDGNLTAALATGVSLSPDVSAFGLDGGIDTGAVGLGWYYVWLVWDGTTNANNTRALYSLSSTAPSTTNFTYTYKAYLGAFYHSGGTWPNAIQRGNRVAVPRVSVMAGAAGVAVYTGPTAGELANFWTAVPPTARAWSGLIGRDDVTASDNAIAIAATSAGNVGASWFTLFRNPAAALTGFGIYSAVASLFDMVVGDYAANPYYWRANAATAGHTFALDVTGYLL